MEQDWGSLWDAERKSSTVGTRGRRSLPGAAAASHSRLKFPRNLLNKPTPCATARHPRMFWHYHHAKEAGGGSRPLCLAPKSGLPPAPAAPRVGEQEGVPRISLCSVSLSGFSAFFYSCWLVFSPSRAGGVDAVLIIFDSKQSQEEEEEKKKEKKNRKKRKKHFFKQKPTHQHFQPPPCLFGGTKKRQGWIQKK